MDRKISSELSEIIQQAVLLGLQNVSSPLPQANANGLETKEYLNVSEAANYTCLAKQTIYQKVWTRTIPFIKKGGRLIFKRQDLIAWLEEDNGLWLGSKQKRPKL